MTSYLANDTSISPTFQVTEVDATATQATLVIEPLEQGYGHTLGNALRRVLLTSLPGHAITVVKIEGIEHQYSTLEGLREDILELILNIKQVRVTSISDEPRKLTLTVKGPAEVTAADIECEAGAEVVNPDQRLATLGKGANLKVEMTVEAGLGYQMATDRTSSVIGEMAVDALFSPVIKVSYTVESTRVGRRTDYDKIVMQIATNGTITPLEAVRKAAAILARQFNQIVTPVMPEEKQEVSSLTPEEAETLRLTVEELDLPTRIANALRKGGFKTVGDLQGMPSATIAKVKNLGEKSVDIINEALQKKGVTLGE